MKYPLCILIFTMLFLCGYSQERIGVALYDVGNLYDTTPSPRYNDSEYTPHGKRQWSETRYQHKIEQIARVIDTMALPAVVLYGVENQSVLRDIQRISKLDYSSLHRTLDYYNGLDFSLLYYGDMLHIDHTHTSLYYTYIGGEISGHTIAIHLTRRGSHLRTLLPPGKTEMPEITIVWGRLSRKDLKRLGLCDPLRNYEREGRGDTMSKGGWYLHNRLGVAIRGGDVEIEKAGIYITQQLLDKSGKRPLATYSNSGYTGGYSRHLPQYIFIKNL